jgi:phage terminase large subunit-like protein
MLSERERPRIRRSNQLPVSTDTLRRWRSQPITFIEEVLHDPETKRPFQLLPAERSFLTHAFERDDSGRLRYPEQCFSAPKKSGKSTLASLHTLVTVLLFGGSFGEAVLLANDFEQAQGRVFEMCRRIVECSPVLKPHAKVTKDTISFRHLGASIIAVPSDYASIAGGNQNIAVFDELWAYTSERAFRLWDEMCVVPTRDTALRLTVSYAGFSNESTLLENLYQRGLQQPRLAPNLYGGDGLLMFWSHHPVAPWQTPEWIAEMRRTLRPAAFTRLIENRFTEVASNFVDMAWVDECTDPTLTPTIVDRTLPVVVGVDASVKRDSTAIVVVHWDKRLQKCRLVFHRTFQPSPSEPLDFEASVEATILDLHRRFRLQAVLFDPYQLVAVSQRLTRAGIPMREFAQSIPGLTEIGTNLYELIRGRNLWLYPDAEVRLAISRAVVLESPRGWRIGKEKQSHKIDIVVALAMAALGSIQQQTRYDTTGNWIDGPDRDPDPQAQLDRERQAFRRQQVANVIMASARKGWPLY